MSIKIRRKEMSFKKGDRVVCVDQGRLPFLRDGDIYTIEDTYNIPEDTYYACCNVRNEKGEIDGGFLISRFKLCDNDLEFQAEYFSALNEKDAEVYLGRPMEFADTPEVRENKWMKDRLSTITPCSYPFSNKGRIHYQFMRTCPETFAKKKVKKVVEVWAAMFKEGGHAGFYAGKSGAEKAWPELDYVKLTGEYEVEEFNTQNK